MINRALITRITCIGLASLCLAQLWAIGKWDASSASIQASDVTFDPSTPTLDTLFTVWGHSTVGLAYAELGVDRWQYVERDGGLPWDSSGREDNPDYTQEDPPRWGWDVEVSQPGDYVFTLYSDCNTGCVVVAQSTVNVPDPDADVTFDPSTPTLDTLFTVWGHSTVGLAYVELGVDRWQYVERDGGLPWDSSGREDNPDYTQENPPRWGWDVEVSQPGNYVFTLYSDCNTGCVVVAQSTVNVPDPVPTNTPTDTPTPTPTNTPVSPTITWTPSATPTPKGDRLPTPDPSHTPEPTHIYNPDSDADHLPDTYECPLMPCRDTDGDGVPDYLDSDSDGDGISDLVEGEGDPDPDGIPNYRDLDSDDDTIPDYIESFGDTDGDGIPNFIDTDSDADGLSDEAEGVGDIDGDDIPNFLDNNANDGPSADADGDGILNGTEDTDDGDGDGNPDPDRDGDGIKNKADTDSDDDGIHDIIEGQGDPDLDGIPNYLDLDSDGDGLLDEDEGVPDYLIPNSRAFLPLVLDEDGTGRATHDLVDAPDQCVAGQVVQLGHSYRDDFDWLTGAPAWYYDKDWYTFGGVAGQTYVLETSDLGARADTVLQLYSPSCETLLAENDDVVPNEDKRSRLVWVAPADGTYHVLITQWDYVTHGVETHYTFSVSTGDGSDTIGRPPKPFPPKPPRPSPPAVGASSSRTPAGAANQTEAAPSMLLLAALSAPAATFALTRRDAGLRRESLAALGS